jgi:prevent-host-death family protein
MSTINIYQAKTQLSKLIDRAAGGEEIVIARHGKPVARLTSLDRKTPVRFGILAGKVTIADDFDAPLPRDVLESFGEH